jgi:uncharacterized membrane protein YeaQ/YmgE (transglycosylase-associated protein family)
MVTCQRTRLQRIVPGLTCRQKDARTILLERISFVSARKGTKEKAMSIIGWIVLGLIAGFIASQIVNRTGMGLLMDIVLGIVGALVGGFLFNAVGAVGVTGFNIWSMFVAVIGAVVVLWLYHALAGRRAF